MRVATNAELVLGVEGAPQDYNLPMCSFYDEHPFASGIDVPLYDLVYHECAVLYRQHGVPYNYGLDNYGYPRAAMADQVPARPALWRPVELDRLQRAYYAWRETFKAINDVLAPHHERLAHEELLEHEILTPDLLVQRTASPRAWR